MFFSVWTAFNVEIRSSEHVLLIVGEVLPRLSRPELQPRY